MNWTVQVSREEANRNEIAGTAAGEVVKMLWALISNYPGVASWHNAIRLTQLTAVRACTEQTRRSAARCFEMFLCEAETLFEQLQEWDSAKQTRSEYLAIDAVHPAPAWRPPQWRHGWPITGGIFGLKIDEASVPEIANLKKAGRPRGNPV